MNDEQIKYLLTFLNDPNFVVWCYCGEWLRFNGDTRLTNGELPEYMAITTQGLGKYIDLYNVDANDLCITKVVPNAHRTILSMGE